MKKIALLCFILAISLAASAKEYAEKDVTKKNDMYYDSHNNPITGTIISKDKTLITNVKDGKLHGDMLLYSHGVLRGKNTFQDGKLRVQDTYWPNKKLRTHRPIVAHYVNGQLMEKYKEEPTTGYYKNGKPMFSQTMKETNFYDKNGKLLAQLFNGDINKAFCLDNGKKRAMSIGQINILINEFNRIMDHVMDEQEADFSKFKCESPEKTMQEVLKKQSPKKND